MKVVYATAALLNWIIDWDGENGWEESMVAPALDVDGHRLVDEEVPLRSNELVMEDWERIGGVYSQMSQYRDRIAKRMWRDYCDELQMRGEV